MGDRDRLDLAYKAPVMMWSCGFGESRDWFNLEWLSFTGRSLAEEQSGGWLRGLHPEDVQRCSGVFDEACHSRRSFQVQYRLRRHDGEYRWLSDRGKPDGQRFIGVCTDIHDQHHAAEELEHTVASATRLVAEKDALLREVHHRVKNNLQLIISLVGLRARDIKQAEARRELLDMIGRIGNLAQVEDLLHRTPDLTTIDLADYLRQLAARLASQSQDPGMKIDAELKPASIVMDHAIPLGLLVTELLLGIARRHSSAEAAEVSMRLAEGDAADSAVLWLETGSATPLAEADKGSMGRRLIEALARQAGALLAIEEAEGRSRISITLTTTAADRR